MQSIPPNKACACRWELPFGRAHIPSSFLCPLIFYSDSFAAPAMVVERAETQRRYPHTGAKPKEDKKAPKLHDDNTGLLEWNSNIRATIYFTSVEEFLTKKDLFKKAIKLWVIKTKDL